MKDLFVPKARIVVVLEPHPEAARLLRSAKRKAELEHLEWEVLVVETQKMHRRLTPAERENLQNMATLAQQMGAIVTKTYAKTMLEGVLEHVQQIQQRGVSIYSIKMGNIHKKRYFFHMRPSLYMQLKKAIGTHPRIATIPLGFEPPIYKKIAGFFHLRKSELQLSLLIFLGTLCVLEGVNYFYPEAFMQNRNRPFFLLIGVIIAARAAGFLAGLMVTVLGFLALSYYYVPLTTTPSIQSSQMLNVALFMLVGFITSLLANSDYGDRLGLLKRSERFSNLLSVHRLVLNKKTQDETIETLNHELYRLLKTEVAIFLPSLMDDEQLECVTDRDIALSPLDKKALNIAWLESKSAGIGTPYSPEGSRWRFEPMVTSQDEIGVIGALISSDMEADEDFSRTLSGIADQVALILERLQLGHLAEESKIQAEREKLRSMLLSSVSHDLKTPLASVIGSLSVFRSAGLKLPEEHRHTLINTALEEAQRLDSFITNILDMTRIESGQVEMRKEWMDPVLLIEDVTRRMRDRLRSHPVRVTHSKEPSEVFLDPLMTGQVLQNLLDNAAKYTKHNTPIEVSWSVENHQFKLQVRDHGAGIPPDQLEKVFDKYSRIRKQDSQIAGTGLGLAISRAVIQAQGGYISASNHPDGGAMFTITLPEVRSVQQEVA